MAPDCQSPVVQSHAILVQLSPALKGISLDAANDKKALRRPVRSREDAKNWQQLIQVQNGADLTDDNNDNYT